MALESPITAKSRADSVKSLGLNSKRNQNNDIDQIDTISSKFEILLQMEKRVQNQIINDIFKVVCEIFPFKD